MDVFVDIDQSTWTQDQKNMTAAIAYALAHDAGQTLSPVTGAKGFAAAGQSQDVDFF